MVLISRAVREAPSMHFHSWEARSSRITWDPSFNSRSWIPASLGIRYVFPKDTESAFGISASFFPYLFSHLQDNSSLESFPFMGKLFFQSLIHWVFCISNHLNWKEVIKGTSPVVQWLRIHLPMQGTRAWSLVQEGPTLGGASKPVSHNCWAWAPRACELHLLKPTCLEAVLHNKRNHHKEKPRHRN